MRHLPLVQLAVDGGWGGDTQRLGHKRLLVKLLLEIGRVEVILPVGGHGERHADHIARFHGHIVAVAPARVAGAVAGPV